MLEGCYIHVNNMQAAAAAAQIQSDPSLQNDWRITSFCAASAREGFIHGRGKMYT